MTRQGIGYVVGVVVGVLATLIVMWWTGVHL